MRRLVLGLLLTLLMVFSMTAQEDITSEDDLTRMLYEDDISYEDYILLLEIYREKVDVNGNNVGRLAELPWITSMDVNEILELRKQNGNYFKSMSDFESIYGDAFEKIEAFITVLPPNLKLYNGKLRLYNRNRLSESGYDPYTTSKLSFRAESFGFDISARQEDFEPLYIRSRSVYFDYGKHRLEIGNFQQSIGAELLFGRHLYITKSLRETDPALSIITPADGYNNGIFWEMKGDFHPKAAITINDYDSIAVSGYAGQLGYLLNEDIEVGGVITLGSIEDKMANETYNQSAFSAYTLGRHKDWRYELEAGYSESPGASGMLSYSESGLSINLSLWTYGKDFTPFFSDGFADKNKSTTELTENFSFSSAQKAETGGKFDVRMPLGEMFKLRIWNSYWQNNQIDEHGSYISATLYAYDFWGESRGNIGYTYESNPQGGEDNTKETFMASIIKDFDKTEVKYYFNLRDYTTVEQLLDYQYDGLEDDYIFIAETDDDRSLRLSTYLSQEFAVTDWMDISMRQKIYDPDVNQGADGYFEFSLAEDIDISDVNLKLEGRWKTYFDEDDDDIWELRFNLATGFGFEQVVREKGE